MGPLRIGQLSLAHERYAPRVSLNKLICFQALAVFGLAGSLHAARAASGAAVASPGDVVYPADAGVTNVKRFPFNAAGDGVTDDTAALQAALCGNRNGVWAGGGSVNRVVYLPAGTYLISAPLTWCTGYLRYETMQGQNAATTIIRVAPNSPAFANPAAPVPVISMTGLFNGQPVAGTATSFRNSLFDLGLSIGAGNPGATGIAYLASNQGSIRHVSLSAAAGSGAVGLDLTAAAQGPAMIHDLSVSGFATGIATAGEFSTVTFEDIVLSGQRVAGWTNDGFRISVNGLSSNNSVPAIVDHNIGSFTVLMNAQLLGGAGGAAMSTSGYAYLRNVTTTGYARVLDVAGRPAAAGAKSVTEYTTAALRSANARSFPLQSLNLPVRPTPDTPLEAPANWTNAQSFGARANVSQYNVPAVAGDDASAGIQAAIDSGATTLYLPNGIYTLRNSVHLRGRLTRLYGMDSVVKLAPPLSTTGAAAFIVDDGTAPVVTIERIDTDFAAEGGACVFVQHASARTVVIRNTSNNRCDQAYGAASGAGDLYVEDVAGTDWRLSAQNAWFRQINPEGRSFLTPPTLSNAARKFTFTGSTAWVFGTKTEGNGIIGDVGPASRAEFLGGFMANSTGEAPSQPAFLGRGGSFSVIGSENSDPYATYGTVVVDTAGGKKVTLPNLRMPARFAGSLFLYNNAAPLTAPAPAYHDGMQTIQAVDWDLAPRFGGLSPCRWGVADYSGNLLPPMAGTASCMYGGNWVAYRNVSFTKAPSSVTIRYASQRTDSPSVELRLGTPTGPLLASVTVVPTGVYSAPYIPGRQFGYFRDVTVPVSGLTRGRATIYLLAVADRRTGGVAEVNAVTFGGFR